MTEYIDHMINQTKTNMNTLLIQGGGSEILEVLTNPDLCDQYKIVNWDMNDDTCDIKVYFDNINDQFDFQCDYNINLEEEIEYSVIHELDFDLEDIEDLEYRYNLTKYEVIKNSPKGSVVKFYFNYKSDLLNFQSDFNPM